MTQRTIRESEFRAVEDRRKQWLSDLIRRADLPFTHIATATGVERRAVKRAADCEGIRFDTAVRLEYFLLWYLKQNEHNLKNTEQ